MTIVEVGVSASTHGHEPTRLAAKIAEYGRGDRFRRALRRFLPIFGVGCACLLIPPHVPWLLGFTLVGSVLATQRLKQASEILSLAGTCPGCAAEQTLDPPLELPAIKRCPGCGAFLKLERV
jgi:hypothetical protein